MVGLYESRACSLSAGNQMQVTARLSCDRATFSPYRTVAAWLRVGRNRNKAQGFE